MDRMKKQASSSTYRTRRDALVIAVAGVLATGSTLHAASIADWKTFTSTTTQDWNTAGSWTAGTGIPTSGTSLVVNFDPAKTGTTVGTAGGISNGFIANNNIGTVQLNALNVSGFSTASVRTITIQGGALQFAGTSASITNTTSTAALVNYVVTSNVLLDADLTVNSNGTGSTTILSGTSGSLTANTPGTKTLTFAGTGAALLGTASSAANVVSDGTGGNGAVAIVQSGTGTLTLGGSNTFSGGVKIQAGTVRLNGSTAGSATSFGTGTIEIGNTTGTADATLLFDKTVTLGNAVTTKLATGGQRIIENAGGSAIVTMTGLLTVDQDLNVKYTGASSGSVKIGSAAGTAYITGSKNITFDSTGTGSHELIGTNSNFLGGIIVNTGTTRVNSDVALSASNVVSVASGATFASNNRNQTIAGLTNVSGSGGTVTNTGASVRTFTLGGGGTYSFAGSITGTTTANTALTVALTGTGKQTLTGNSDYDGATSITSGTLIIDGDNTAANGAVSVSSGATLGGNGTIGGAVSVSGMLAPGSSAGDLLVKSTVGLANNSTFAVELNGATSGTGYDQLIINNATGTGLTIGTGVNLQVSLGFSPAVNSFFAIVDNDLADAVSGEFSKLNGVTTTLSDGSTFTVGARTFRIDYDAIALTGAQSGGNDVVLTVVPEPATLGALALGIGGLLTRRRRQ